MSTLAWLCAIFGFAVSVFLTGVIVSDIYLVRTGQETISERLLTLGSDEPWVPAVLGCVAGLILGCLLGHLWFPQERPRSSPPRVLKLYIPPTTPGKGA